MSDGDEEEKVFVRGPLAEACRRVAAQLGWEIMLSMSGGRYSVTADPRSVTHYDRPQILEHGNSEPVVLAAALAVLLDELAARHGRDARVLALGNAALLRAWSE